MKRTKSGKILIRVGPDSAKRLARNEAIAKKQRERADQRAAKKEATAARNAAKKAAKAAAAARRRAARKAATKARRKAARDRYNNTPSDQRPKRKRPWHPKGPNATEKYTSYARRRERSKKLTATRIGPKTFTCNGYTINVTAGDDPIPLSCTCPDFTQVEGARNWQGSNAGPFNPCKHMMAVRDGSRWSCSNGVCFKTSGGQYATKAQCEAALIPPSFTGGQCNVPYYIKGYLRRNSVFGDQTFGYFDNAAESPVPLDVLYQKLFIGPGFGGAEFVSNGVGGGGVHFYNKNGVVQFSQGDISSTLVEPMTFTVVSLQRVDGLPDNCGNAPPTCP